MNNVIVSVIMSAYNCAPYIAEAIDSIINQTFKDWELIICDDGSDDGTWEVIQRYQVLYPERIIALRNEKNRKQAFSRNRCIKKARGKYIAIMDADDKCDSMRLEKQVAYLSSHPEIAFVGTGMYIFDEKGIWGASIHKENIQPADLIMTNGFVAASCMFRKDVLFSVRGYRTDPKFYFVEDYELFQRLYMAGYKGANIKEPLYSYREYKQTIKRRRFKNRIHGVVLRMQGIRTFRLSPILYMHVARYIIAGMLPQRIYLFLHRRRYS